MERLKSLGLVYLATPYSKYPGGTSKAYKAAAEVAARLLKAGVCVFSPITHGHPISLYGGLDPLDHSIWLPFDEGMMHACRALVIAKMAGWRESFGITQEIVFFTRWQKPIFELDPETLELTPRYGDKVDDLPPEHLF